MVNRLDVAILSALEVDTDFKRHVMTGSDVGLSVGLLVVTGILLFALRCLW